jgi:hypothetical protein
MKQYILFTVIVFLIPTSTISALGQEYGKPLESGSRIELNEETGQWEIVGSKAEDAGQRDIAGPKAEDTGQRDIAGPKAEDAGQRDIASPKAEDTGQRDIADSETEDAGQRDIAGSEAVGQVDEKPSYITRLTCSVPPIKDFLIAPYLVHIWIDNGCINPAALEKVVAPIIKEIPAEKVKENIDGYDLLSRLAASNEYYREKRAFYEKIALEDQPNERAEAVKRENCTKKVDDDGLIEETLDLFFPTDRFGPKPHSLNDWCYEKESKRLIIVINYKNETEAIAKDLAKRIHQEMIMASRKMRHENQPMSPFQKIILTKGINVMVTWPGRMTTADLGKS